MHKVEIPTIEIPSWFPEHVLRHLRKPLKPFADAQENEPIALAGLANLLCGNFRDLRLSEAYIETAGHYHPEIALNFSEDAYIDLACAMVAANVNQDLWRIMWHAEAIRQNGSADELYIAVTPYVVCCMAVNCAPLNHPRTSFLEPSNFDERDPEFQAWLRSHIVALVPKVSTGHEAIARLNALRGIARLANSQASFAPHENAEEFELVDPTSITPAG